MIGNHAWILINSGSDISYLGESLGKRCKTRKKTIFYFSSIVNKARQILESTESLHGF